MTDDQIEVFLQQIVHGRLQRYVSQAVIVDSSQRDERGIMASGTASYVNTGHDRLVVTNAHVYAEFLELKKQNTSARLCLFGNGRVDPFDISTVELIDNGRQQVDLAVLRASNPNFVSELNKDYFPAKTWPPQRASVGEWAICVGFPTQFRQIKDHVIFAAGRSVVGPVSGSYHDKFVLRADDAQRTYVDLNPKNPKTAQLSYGGMSGSAVYLYNLNTKKVRLGGFVSEASDGLQGTLAVLHADFILENGKLDARLIL